MNKIYKKQYNKVLAIVLVILLVVTGLFTYYNRKSKVVLDKNCTPKVQRDIKEKDIKPNAQNSLKFPTAYKTSQVTHGSVINFDKEWYGYKYWMANTPYPKGDAKKENPHIFVSNDMINWNTPKEGLNPLDEPDFKTNPKSYNSDPDLIYNKEKNQLELFWRFVNKEERKIYIYHTISKDGVNWSKKRISFKGGFLNNDAISPAYVRDNNTYKMWYVTQDFKINYRESKDAVNWSKPIEIIVPYKDKKLKHWHIDVKKHDGVYEMLISGFELKSKKKTYKDRKNMSLYFSSSKDNKTWSTANKIIQPSAVFNNWDGRGLYRSSFIKENNKYIVFYSGISCKSIRGLGISVGSKMEDLQGLDKNDSESLKKLLK